MEPQELIVSENVPARHVHEIYTNLDRGRREIRLISVTPGEWSDEINCEFTVASLDDRPEYYALSYTWGDPTITRPIIINGVRKQATVSLESALRRLRETAEPSIMIWIDALCINQEDSVERSHQVGMMGDIYRFTREALIWIGEEEADCDFTGYFIAEMRRLPDNISQAGLEELNVFLVENRLPLPSLYSLPLENTGADDLSRAYELLHMLADDRHIYELPFYRLNLDSKLEFSPSWYLVLERLVKHLCQPWWKRMWTLQEAVLASRATVICGAFLEPLDTYLKAAFTFQHHYTRSPCCRKWLWYFDREICALREFSYFASAIFNLRPDYIDDSEYGPVYLSDILHQARFRDTSEIRDRIYGVLGLVTDWAGASPIVPDYSLPVAEVFCQAAQVIIQNTGTLNLLCHKKESASASVEGCHSWVPYMSKVADLKYNTPSWDFFAASKGSKPNLIQCSNGVLAVTGFKIDLIASVGEKLRQGKELLQIATLARLARREIDSEDLWYTLTSGIVIDVKMRRARREDIAKLRSAIIFFSDYPELCGAGRITDDQPSYFKFRLENFYRYCISIVPMRKTRFFVTEGGAIGMGPLSTHPGDLVFVLRGGSVPFVLRPLGQRHGVDFLHNPAAICYSLVGHCYMHGIMDGEIMDRYNIDEQTVCLL